MPARPNRASWCRTSSTRTVTPTTPTATRGAVETTQAIVAAHPLLHPDLALEDGHRLDVGALTLRCFHVPGHSRGPHRALRGNAPPPHHRRPAVRRQGRRHIVRRGCAHRVAKPRSVWLPRSPTMRPCGPDTTTAHRPSSTMALEKSTNPFLRVSQRERVPSLENDVAVVQEGARSSVATARAQLEAGAARR